MLEAIREWLWKRRERRLYRQMSRTINRDRREMAPLRMPLTSDGKRGEGSEL